MVACFHGDLQSAKAAVADGASVNQSETTRRAGSIIAELPELPLAVAVATNADRDVVQWLLSVGADPNGHMVMPYCATTASTDILQLVVDAGGGEGCGVLLPLLLAIAYKRTNNVRLLLAQPSLAITDGGVFLETHARGEGCHGLADIIAREVSRMSGGVHPWCAVLSAACSLPVNACCPFLHSLCPYTVRYLRLAHCPSTLAARIYRRRNELRWYDLRVFLAPLLAEVLYCTVPGTVRVKLMWRDCGVGAVGGPART